LYKIGFLGNIISGDNMDNEILVMFLRSVFVVFILFILTKLMGKKQVSQMNMYDYLVGITIGSIAADISLNLERDFVGGLISLLVYSLFGVIVTWLSLKNLNFRKIFSGNPTILIDKGNILVDNLRKEGVDINSLEEEARLNGYFDLGKINYAVLETNGQISFLPRVKDDYVTNNNMKLKVKENELSINLIQDGVVMRDNLNYIKKDEIWLDKIIKKNGYNSSEEIFLMVYKNDSDIILYDYKKNAN